jgi:arabinogalactan endo-1,4-beta-galactosidase
MRTSHLIAGSIVTFIVAGCGAADPPQETTGVATEAVSLSMLGADVSSVQRALDLGASYFDASGAKKDPLDILKAAGANYIRLRVWNNPASGYNNQAKVLAYAKTVKSKGLKLLIDLQYSDTWADPSHQAKPAAWSSHNITQLQTDVFNFTSGICNALKAQGTTPDAMQIGNETNIGMLFSDGEVINSNFTNFSLLLKQGYKAIKACNSGTQVLIHTSDSDSDANARWFYDGIKAQGVSWDVTALSYYCFWHGTASNMQSVVSDLKSRYGKPVAIVETAYPFTTANADSTTNIVGTLCSGYAATWQGQAQNFADVQTAARNGGAIGVFYWEPTWYAVKGNGWDPGNISGSGDNWDNMALFDWTGHFNPNVSWKP